MSNQLNYNLFFSSTFHHLVNDEVDYPNSGLTKDIILEALFAREHELILDSLGCIDACL